MFDSGRQAKLEMGGGIMAGPKNCLFVRIPNRNKTTLNSVRSRYNEEES